MKKNFIEELKWRRMLHDAMPGTEEQLQKGMTKGYIGFDPTADSLGVGNLVQIMTLLHFQSCGHKPIALIGGATGMVGDPSGKSAERNLLSEDILRHNQACQRRQMEKFLDFNCGDNSAAFVNNYDWFKEFTFLDFIRDVGKRLTVNYMMAKDSVKNRISGEDREGMSFTEFTYQLIQGYDYYHLWKNEGVMLQMGGSDQWGNITTGTELIRRMAGGEAYALTTPLIKKADGTKFGKTEGGNIWLDPERTSPYAFYQFWLNASDEDVANYIRIFTLKGKEEIDALEAAHQQDKGKRLLQKALADDITIRVHSQEDLNLAIAASGVLFGRATVVEMRDMPASILNQVAEALPKGRLNTSDLNAGISIQEALVKTGFFESNGKAKRALEENSISVNKEKASSDRMIVREDILPGNLIFLQKGKKDYFLVEVKD
jgi:tyrosyl-tRNA synthetase